MTCTMLHFHGNAGNIGHRLHNAQALYQHSGVNILLVEYRGYGKSEESLVSIMYVCIYGEIYCRTHMDTWFYNI